MRRSLQASIENEQHWFLVSCGGEEHVVLIGRSGPTFPDHPLSCLEVATEGALLAPAVWGCHFLARWWLGRVELWHSRIQLESEGLLRLSMDTLNELDVFSLVGTPSSVFFLARLMRQRDRTHHVQWEASKRST